MNEHLEVLREAAEIVARNKYKQYRQVVDMDLEQAHAFFDDQVVPAPPRPVPQYRYEPPAIDITEEEYIAMYRSQDPGYAEPKQVVIGDVIMMPSGIRYRVNLPPKRVLDEPIPF